MKKQAPETMVLNVRHVPTALVKNAKLAAIGQDKTLTEFLIEALTEAVAKSQKGSARR